MSVVINQIADAIETRLSTLTGDTVAGVQMTVIRPKARGYSPVHGEIVINYGGNTRAEAWDAPGNPFREGREQVFLITVGIRDEADSTNQIIESASEVYGEVIGQLKPGADWYTFGGIAKDADVGDWEPIQPSGGIGGFTFPIRVWYRTPEGAVDSVG